MKPRILSAEQLEEFRVMYVNPDISGVQIAARFKINARTVSILAQRIGCPMKGRRWKAGRVKYGPPRPPTPPKARPVVVATPKTDSVLYGALLEDVRFLRRRGFCITAERGSYRVGNRLLDAAGVVEIADRERRLCNPPPVRSVFVAHGAAQ